MRIGFLARPIVDDFEFAALKNFPCVELNFHTDLEALERAGEIRAWCQKYEVDLSHVGLFGRNYLAEDREERAAHLEALGRVTEFAAAVRAPLVTTGGGLLPGLDVEASCARAVETLGPAVERAPGLGLQFAFYNCRWTNFVTGPEAWEKVLTALPSAGIKFDPSHPLHYGQDWLAQLAAWGHRVLHTHAKDTLQVAGQPFEDVPAGLGSIAWGQFFAALYHHGYAGDINIEPHSKTWSGERLYSGILLARRHLEQFLPPPSRATREDVRV